MTPVVIAAVHLLLAVLALPLLAACTYLLVLTLLSARLPLLPKPSRDLRFDVLVPAHNESAVIETCIASLQRLDWPTDCYRILVIADNCEDATARLARAAGVTVLERADESARGKGHALRFAFDHSSETGWADALVIVDADTEVSTNLLTIFAACIESGAGVVQAHYGVRNPGESWRTGLLAIAHGAFHGVRSRARERLRLSCGVRGNGWCITHDTLRQVPYQAFSLTEDLEFGIALGLAGQRVHYSDEAYVDAEMESREPVAVRQRQRWEDGRFDLLRLQLMPLLRTALRKRSAVALDLAIDLMVLPLSYVALGVLLLTAVSATASLWQPDFRIWLPASVFCVVCLSLYVLRGWQLSGRGLAGLGDLMWAPVFVLWKLIRVLRAHDRKEWAPTRRKGP